MSVPGQSPQVIRESVCTDLILDWAWISFLYRLEPYQSTLQPYQSTLTGHSSVFSYPDPPWGFSHWVNIRSPITPSSSGSSFTSVYRSWRPSLHVRPQWTRVESAREDTRASKTTKKPRLPIQSCIAYYRTRSFDVIPAVVSALGLSTLNPAVVSNSLFPQDGPRSSD